MSSSPRIYAVVLTLGALGALGTWAAIAPAPALAYDQSCSLTTPCPSGEECFGGTCIKRCNADSECTGGPFHRCLDGQCRARACNADADCGARKACRASGYTTSCVDVQCNADNQCSFGDFCIDYTCKDCKQNRDCTSNLCDTRTNTCQSCRSATDCPAGFNYCQSGVCGQCFGDSQCAPNQVCTREHTCLTVQCKVAADCGTGMDCIANRCAFLQNDFRGLRDEIQRIKSIRLVPQGAPVGGLPCTTCPFAVDLGETSLLLNASKYVKSSIGVVVLDPKGRRLFDLGRYTQSTSGLGVPGSLVSQPASAVPSSGDRCGYQLAITDQGGTVQAATGVCLN